MRNTNYTFIARPSAFFSTILLKGIVSFWNTLIGKGERPHVVLMETVSRMFFVVLGRGLEITDHYHTAPWICIVNPNLIKIKQK